MLTVGLTGGIGSGKSLVARIFFTLGIPVFHADSEAGKILDQDITVRETLTQWFGPGTYIQDKPDRNKIAGIVFNDPVQLAKMNELIHPLVMDQFIKWCGFQSTSPYVIHEAAILYESGLYRHLDRNILVTAPEETRITRVKNRDGVSDEMVRARMKNQWTDEQKSPLADYIIRNDGQTPLIPAVLDIHHQLIQ